MDLGLSFIGYIFVFLMICIFTVERRYGKTGLSNRSTFLAASHRFFSLVGGWMAAAFLSKLCEKEEEEEDLIDLDSRAELS